MKREFSGRNGYERKVVGSPASTRVQKVSDRKKKKSGSWKLQGGMEDKENGQQASPEPSQRLKSGTLEKKSRY